MKKKKGPTVFCKTITNHWRQTRWNSSMKEILKSQFLQSLQSLQWWSKTTNEDNARASFSQYLAGALLKNTQCQHHCLLSPNSHKSGGLLFGKLESQFSCAAWANYTFANFGKESRVIFIQFFCFIFENVIVKTLVSAQDLQTFINVFVALIVFCLLPFWQAFQFPHRNFCESCHQFFWKQKS